MKTLLTAIALFFSLPLCMAQTGLVSGNLNVTTFPSNVGGGRFQVAGSFSDPKGQWFASDVDTGMIMWKGNNLYLIDSIITASGANITFRVQDIYSTGFIATGTAQVLELTENLGLPAVSTTGDSNAALATPPDHAALLNYLVGKIDSIVGNLLEEPVIINPYGGDNTTQSSVDSLFQNQNQIIVATDSFYVNDQDQPVYLVAAGDTITLPAAAEYTAGSGINIDTLGVISATDNSATNEIQTLSIAGNNLSLSNGGGTVAVPSGADGNGIYGGSGTLPGDVRVNEQGFGLTLLTNPTSKTVPDFKIVRSGFPGIGTNPYILLQDSSGLGDGVSLMLSLMRNTTELFKIRRQSNSTTIEELSNTLSLNAQQSVTVKSIAGTIRLETRYPIVSGLGDTATVFPHLRPVGSNSFWQHNTDGTAEYKTPGAMAVTNPYGGTNTIQAALDSAGVNGTWLKPELEAGDVTINSADNALILNKASMTTDPAIYVVHPVPTIGVTRRLFSAGQTSSGYAFEIAQHSDNSYKISTSQALLTLESSSLGDPTQAQLGNGEMYIVNTSGPSSIKLNATSNTVSIAASPTNAENWTLTLPTTKGSAGQFLQTNGNGVSGWAAPVVPNIGGISALHTGASYSYTAQVLGDTTGNALSLSTTVGVKSGITKIITAGGHGIQTSFGGTATCEVSAFVTIQGNSDWFGLQIMVNNQPVYSNVYAALPASDLWPSVSTSLSHIIDLNNNDVVTIKIMSTDANIVNVVSAGLTVKKTQ